MFTHSDNTSFLVFDTALRENRQTPLKLPWDDQSTFLDQTVPCKLRLPNVRRWEIIQDSTGASTSGVSIPQTTSWHRKRLMAARFARTDDQLRDVVNRKAREWKRSNLFESPIFRANSGAFSNCLGVYIHLSSPVSKYHPCNALLFAPVNT